MLIANHLLENHRVESVTMYKSMQPPHCLVFHRLTLKRTNEPKALRFRKAKRIPRLCLKPRHGSIPQRNVSSAGSCYQLYADCRGCLGWSIASGASSTEKLWVGCLQVIPVWVKRPKNTAPWKAFEIAVVNWLGWLKTKVQGAPSSPTWLRHEFYILATNWKRQTSSGNISPQKKTNLLSLE